MRNIRRSLTIIVGCFTIMVIICQNYNWNVLGLDEGTYLSIGMLMSKGWVVYRDVFESKPPLFHFINYLIYLIVGNRIHAARLFYIGAAALTAYLIFELVDRYYEEKTAITAAIFFSISSSLPIFGGLRVLTEPFSTFFLVSTMYAYSHYQEKRNKKLLVLIGMLSSAYILVRPTGVLFITTLTALSYFRWKTIRRQEELKNLLSGAIVLPLIFGVFFLYHGALKEAIFWVLEPSKGFNRYVITSISQKRDWIYQVAITTLPILILSLFSLRDRENQVTELNLTWILILPSIFFVTFLPGFPHYYYELLPAVTIQAAIGVRKITKHTRGKKKIIIALGLLLSTGVAVMESKPLYTDNRKSIDLPLLKIISSDILEHTQPEDTIFIYETAWPKLGPSLYYLTERAPPIKNLFFHPWIMSETECQRILNTIINGVPKLVVLIGPEPLISEVIQIKDNIQKKYTLVKEYVKLKNVIYPHIEEDLINVSIYKRQEN